MISVNLDVDDELVSFDLPTSWEEVTIGDFVKLFSFDRENMSVMTMVIKSISVLGNVDEDKLYMIPINDFEKIAKAMDFLNVEMEPTKEDFVDIDGERYYIKFDFQNFTMGEVISIETIMSKAENNIFRVMDELLCVFLRKKKENGNLETFKGDFLNRKEIFSKAPISKVFQVFNFFFAGGNLLLNNTNQSSVTPPKKKRKSKAGLKTLDNK